MELLFTALVSVLGGFFIKCLLSVNTTVKTIVQIDPELGRQVVGPRVCFIRSLSGRLIGFLHHLQPPKDYVLGFKVGWGSRTFHTVGMHFAIDIVALDCKGNVLQIVENLTPGIRRIKLPRRTYTVLEFAEGQAARFIKHGTQVQLV